MSHMIWAAALSILRLDTCFLSLTILDRGLVFGYYDVCSFKWTLFVFYETFINKL